MIENTFEKNIAWSFKSSNISDISEGGAILINAESAT